MSNMKAEEESIMKSQELSYVRGAGFLLARLGAMAERGWSSFISASGLTQAEFSVLVVLYEVGSMRQGSVAKRAALDPRNAVATVAALASRGLVTSTIDPSDRRAKLLCISETGKRCLKRVWALLRSERSDFFQPLNETEYAQLSELLYRVYSAHLASSEAAPSTEGASIGPA
jgi:DNA-binding MarR family transcriptional regulator